MIPNFCDLSFKRLPKSSRDGGATLLEVVIVVIVIGVFLTAAYQFLLLTNAKTKSQITDQVLNDKVNLFFATIAKDFRTAKEMEYTQKNGNIETLTLKATDGKTVTYTIQNSEKRILRNGTEIVKGVITRASLDGKKLNISVKNPVKGSSSGDGIYDYNLSVMRRNKLTIAEKK